MEVGKITEYFLQGIYGTSLEISRGIISLLFLFFKKKKLYLAVAHLSPPPSPSKSSYLWLLNIPCLGQLKRTNTAVRVSPSSEEFGAWSGSEVWVFACSH